MVSGAYLNRTLHRYIDNRDGDVYYAHCRTTGEDGLTHIKPCLEYHIPKGCVVELNGVVIIMPPDIYINVDFSYQSIDFSEWDTEIIVSIPFRKLFSFKMVK